VVDDLIDKKEAIVNQHNERMIEANQKILETISGTLKDKTVDAKVRLKITKIF
jgi:hypothetical protein